VTGEDNEIAFDEAHAYAADHGAFVPPEVKGALRLAVFQLAAEKRARLVGRGRSLLFVARDDFGFTVHVPVAPGCVVVLQPELVTLGHQAPHEIQRVLDEEAAPLTELPSACLAGDESIEAARFLDEAHRDTVRKLFGTMSSKGRTWLASRGRSIVIVGRADALAFAVPLVDVPSPTDVIVLNAKGLRLPEDFALAILSHELGHLARRDDKGAPTPQTTEGEMEADSYAVAWGFRRQLREHLASEIPATSDAKLLAQLRARVQSLA
jgi:hypothetical protein